MPNYLDAYRLYQRGGDRVGMASASEALGTLEYYVRQLPRAVRDLDDAVNLYREVGMSEKAAHVSKTLVEARQALAEWASASASE